LKSDAGVKEAFALPPHRCAGGPAYRDMIDPYGEGADLKGPFVLEEMVWVSVLLRSFCK
jgi:hypothetical protein